MLCTLHSILWQPATVVFSCYQIKVTETSLIVPHCFNKSHIQLPHPEIVYNNIFCKGIILQAYTQEQEKVYVIQL